MTYNLSSHPDAAKTLPIHTISCKMSHSLSGRGKRLKFNQSDKWRQNMSAGTSLEVNATVRHDKGKGASRRLRRQEQVPGIVYGGGKEPVSLTLEHKEIVKSLQQESFYSSILTLKSGKKREKVILKALQRHPFKPRIMHVDFQRVRMNEKIHMHVPLHFIGDNVAPGVKEEGGVISHVMSDIEVSCLPDALPEFIEVDVSAMKLNDILHLSDLKVPEGVEIIALSHDDDKSVVSIHLPRVEEEPEPEESAEAEAGEVPASEQKAEGEEAAADKGENKKEGK